MPSLADPKAVEQLFFMQQCRSSVLQQDVAHYERLAEGHPEKNYALLLAAARRYLERERMDKNRREIEGSHGNRDNAHAQRDRSAVPAKLNDAKVK